LYLSIGFFVFSFVDSCFFSWYSGCIFFERGAFRMDIVFFVIDRFEGDVAVCENQVSGEMVSIARSLIEEVASEGDVIFLDGSVYRVSVSETQKAKEDVLSLLKKNRALD